MPSMELDPQKIYDLPKFTCVEEIDGVYLIISPDTANWVIAHNINQLEIYNQLASGKRVIDVIQNCRKEMLGNVMHILTEIEAKRFENKLINLPQEHGLYMYLTNRCNQRCNHCYMYAGEKKEYELSTEEVEKVLLNFSNHGGKVVTFTGGEATIRKDFSEIVCYAKKCGLIVGVLTNGTLWTPEFIQKIKEYIDEVQISIDGYDSNSYRRVRGTNTFDVVLRTVAVMINADIRVTVAITPIIETLLGNEQKYILFAKDLLAKYKDKKFFIKFNTELIDGRLVKPTAQENEMYKSSINFIKKSCLPNSEEQGFALDHRHNTVFNNCGYGGLTIASNGDVFFCNLISQCAKQANVREESFEEILELAKKARKLSDINNLMPCKNCSLKYLCGGGCRVKHFKTLVNKRLSGNDVTQENRTSMCPIEYKKRMLQLMVKANKYFYI